MKQSFENFINGWTTAEVNKQADRYKDQILILALLLNFTFILYLFKRTNSLAARTDKLVVNHRTRTPSQPNPINSRPSITSTSQTLSDHRLSQDATTDTALDSFVDQILTISPPFHDFTIEELFVLYEPLFRYLKQELLFELEVVVEPLILNHRIYNDIIVLKYSDASPKTLPKKIYGNFSIATQKVHRHEKERITNPQFVPQNAAINNYTGVRTDQIQGGSEISNYNLKTPGAGTLGAVLQDVNQHDYYGLTNYHVLQYSQKGHLIEQPAWLKNPENVIGTVLANLGSAQSIPAVNDYAIFKLNTTKRQPSSLLIDNRTRIAGTTSAKPGMVVKKIGRTTGLTYGKIMGINNEGLMSIRPTDEAFNAGIDIEISSPGDSGSVWLTNTDPGYGVGLHSKGENNDLSPGLENEIAFAIPINQVMSGLKNAYPNLKLNFYGPTVTAPHSITETELSYLGTYERLKAIGLFSIPEGHHVVFVNGVNISSELVSKHEAITCQTGSQFTVGRTPVGIDARGSTVPFHYMGISQNGMNIAAMADENDETALMQKLQNSGLLNLPVGYKVAYTANNNSYDLQLSADQVKLVGKGTAYQQAVTNPYSSTLNFSYLQFQNTNTTATRQQANVVATDPQSLSELQQYLRKIGFFQGQLGSKLALIRESNAMLIQKEEQIQFTTTGNNGQHHGDTWHGSTVSFKRVCLATAQNNQNNRNIEDLVSLHISAAFPISIIENFLETIIPNGEIHNVPEKIWVSRIAPITVYTHNQTLFIKSKFHADYTVKVGFIKHDISGSGFLTLSCNFSMDSNLNANLNISVHKFEWDEKPTITVLGLNLVSFGTFVSNTFIFPKLEELINSNVPDINNLFNIRQKAQAFWNQCQHPTKITNLFLHTIPREIRIKPPTINDNLISIELQIKAKLELLSHANQMMNSVMNVIVLPADQQLESDISPLPTRTIREKLIAAALVNVTKNLANDPGVPETTKNLSNWSWKNVSRLGLLAKSNRTPPKTRIIAGLVQVRIRQNSQYFHNAVQAVAIYLDEAFDSLLDKIRRFIKNPENIEAIKRLAPEGTTLAQYISERKCADHLGIEVLGMALNRPIAIITLDGLSRRDLATMPGDPIFVFYNGHNHYDGLKLAPDYNPKEILRELLEPSRTLSSLPAH